NPAAPNTPRRTEDFAVGTLRIVIHGARGRMGGRIAACAEADAGCTVAQRIDRGDALAVHAGDADAVLDFSSSDGAARAAEVSEALGCALLVGTTGLSDGALAAIVRATRRVPVMVAPNTSLGVAVARRLATEAASTSPGCTASASPRSIRCAMVHAASASAQAAMRPPMRPRAPWITIRSVPTAKSSVRRGVFGAAGFMRALSAQRARTGLDLQGNSRVACVWKVGP
ncbi:MAG: hypothetical protein ACKOTD_05530, partial [Phycisphaerales bacterium]